MSTPADADPEGEAVKTAGVGSEVFLGETSVGHVLMADYDDVDFIDVVADATRLEGPTVIARSSEGSHHLYGLLLREWEEVADDLGRLDRASEQYVAEMTDRERCVLRTHAKLRESGSESAPSPIPLKVIDDDRGPFSRPHTVRLRQLAEEAERTSVAMQLERLEDDPRASGETLRQEIWSYQEVDR